MKLDHSDTAQVCRGLGLLLHSGISLGDGLLLLAQEEGPELQALLKDMGRTMDMGGTLGEAMEQTGAFPPAAVGMVKVGENTGRMEDSLNYLAQYYDEQVRTARAVRSALAYPSILLLLMLGVIGVLLVKVLPVFESVYASLGGGMTGIAGSLLGLGKVVEGLLPWLGVLVGLCVGLYLAYRLLAPFRQKVSRWFLTRFGDRGIARKFNNAQFARAMAMGMGSGLTVEESLDLSGNMLGHIPGAEDRCRICRQALEAGEDLPGALGKAQLVPGAQGRMLALGIRSGKGDQVMAEVADRLAEDANVSLEAAVSRIEPVMVLVCSALVGLILLCVMLPLMNILTAIG